MQPGQFAPRNEDYLIRELQQLRADLDRLAAANPFSAMGITPKTGGIDVNGFINSLRADGTVSLSMDDDGAFIVYNNAGAAVARFGELVNSNPGQYGVEILYNGAWVQVGSGNVDWPNISNKPATFPPSSHTHPGSQITSRVGSATDAIGSQSGWTNNVAGTEFYAVWVGNDANYSLGRNVSSVRYKMNIRAHRVDPAKVLKLTPVLYDRIPSPPLTAGVNEYGLIAEQVAEHCPELVTWFNGEIDSVRYDLLGVALLPVVKHQQARIEALEAAMKTLVPGYTPPATTVHPNVPSSMAPSPQPTPLPYTIQES